MDLAGANRRLGWTREGETMRRGGRCWWGLVTAVGLATAGCGGGGEAGAAPETEAAAEPGSPEEPAGEEPAPLDKESAASQVRNAVRKALAELRPGGDLRRAKALAVVAITEAGTTRELALLAYRTAVTVALFQDGLPAARRQLELARDKLGEDALDTAFLEALGLAYEIEAQFGPAHAVMDTYGERMRQAGDEAGLETLRRRHERLTQAEAEARATAPPAESEPEPEDTLDPQAVLDDLGRAGLPAGGEPPRAEDDDADRHIIFVD